MKKFVGSFFFLLVIFLVFLTLKSHSQNEDELLERKVFSQVETLSAKQAKEIDYTLNFPAIIKSDQEVVVKSKSQGQAVWLNFKEADQVYQGEVLVKVDASGKLDSGENNFFSSQIRQQELAVEQAKKAYDLAKENFNEDDSDNNEIAKKIAKLQYQSAQVALQNSLNDSMLTAPVSGVVMEKMITVGDTVVVGQPIAKISPSGKKKIQFFVDGESLPFLKKGTEVEVVLNDKAEKIKAKITQIGLEADLASRKFKIEADFVEQEDVAFGVVASVAVAINEKISQENYFFLPLSALTVGQNESFVFILVDGKAKKISVQAEEIKGEIVKIKANLEEETKIIIEGNKLIQDREDVIDKNIENNGRKSE